MKVKKIKQTTEKDLPIKYAKDTTYSQMTFK